SLKDRIRAPNPDRGETMLAPGKPRDEAQPGVKQTPRFVHWLKNWLPMVQTFRQCRVTYRTTPRAPSINKEGEGLSSTILTLNHP
ncbi:hypothetical protein, partial [Cyclobacterium xiamenense]|uniref:hypothetical protein n=1 Tax=Cyclobacterium xiamenense TaxID=1297121 RepID=UPI001C431C16